MNECLVQSPELSSNCTQIDFILILRIYVFWFIYLVLNTLFLLDQTWHEHNGLVFYFSERCLQVFFHLNADAWNTWADLLLFPSDMWPKQESVNQ